MAPLSDSLSLSLNGKVAIISGSGKENGIGAGIAKALANAGARVAINYVSESTAPRAAEAVASIEVEAGKGSVIVIQADVSTQLGTEKLVQETLSKFGVDHIDILGKTFFLATVYRLTTPGSHFPALLLLNLRSKLKKTFGVNFFGFVHLIRATVPHMPRGGRIINIGSVASKLGISGMPFYVASKAAMDILTFTLAQELGRDGKGITINTLSPGPVDTDSLPQVPEVQALRSWLLSLTRAEDRVGTVEDIADAVLLLASERSRWITGQYISVSGGITGA